MTVLGDLISPAQLDKCGTRDFPVLSMTMHDGIMLQSERFKKSLASIDQSAYKVVQRNQLVVGFPIDEGVLYIQKVVDAGIMSPAYDVWNVKQDIVNLDYLELSLHSPQSMLYYRTNLRGSTARRRSLPKEILLSLPVKLPDMESQRRVVSVIAKVKDIILLYKRLLSALDNLIKARFVEMFGDPASNPMEWMETTVGKECYYIKDGPHKSLPDIGKENGGHPFISVRNIVNHVIDFSTARYVSDEDYADARKKCCPVKGDMLYSKGGTTGIAKLIDVDVEFANWVHLAVLKFDRNVLDGLFFENMLNCDYCYDQSQRLTKGIANRDLVLSAMAQIKMYRPPMELQQQFAAFVSQIDKSKSAIQKSLDETQLLFDSLMQQYFG